jgi:hypothetical protein
VTLWLSVSSPFIWRIFKGCPVDETRTKVIRLVGDWRTSMQMASLISREIVRRGFDVDLETVLVVIVISNS